jgi:hypothetical protein
VGAPVARAIVVVLLLAASCARPVPAAPAIPTATTIVTAGSPCAPLIVAPYLFDNSVAMVPSPTPKPAFTGSHFTGLGKVTSLPSDGASVVLRLVNPLFEEFGPTTVKITSATSFDRSERAWTLVASAGVAAGSTDVKLGADAPAVEAGQLVNLECHRANGLAALEGGPIASAAPQGAATWRLLRPLTSSWPAGTLVWYERTVHVGSLTDLHLAVGQSVIVEMVGAPGDYRAMRLTNAGVTFGFKG